MSQPTAKRDPRGGSNFIDRTGRRYGKLTAIRRMEDKPDPYRDRRHHHVQWLCLCDCGGERIVRSIDLGHGTITNCGRVRHDPRSTRNPRKSLPPGVGARNRVLKQYRRSARDRGLAWELTDKQFDEITSQNCHYCGGPPSTIRHGRNVTLGRFVYNGIDRMDSDRGYVEGNVVPCCPTCNYAKGKMPYDEFLAWVVRLSRLHVRGTTKRRSLTAPDQGALF